MSVEAERIGWRSATPSEVSYYYREEFPKQIENIPDWISPTRPKEFALALDKRYPVIQSGKPEKNQYKTREFIRRSTRPSDGSSNFDNWDDLIDFFASPAYNDPLRTKSSANSGLIDPDTASPTQFKEGEILSPPISKAVYYTLDNHERFWVLGFDIDAKDIAKLAHKHTGGSFEKGDIPDGSRIATDHPIGFPYRYAHVEAAIEYAFDLSEWLKTETEFEKTQVVYSGQGAHVYALDTDPQHRYTQQSRKFLSTIISEGISIPIDQQVTTDLRRVIRIPYSLHADVCRITTPISEPDFDFRINAVPDFIKYPDAGPTNR